MTNSEAVIENKIVSAADNLPVGLMKEAPELTSRGLTTMLIGMCLVPVIIITVLQLTMPPVRPGYLQAEIQLRNVPPASYYQLPPEQRRDFPEAQILITNTMDVPWTNLNIRINHGNYQVYDHVQPIEAGQQRSFLLSKFVHRSGTELQVGLVQPVDVEVYAALPDRSRATLEYSFDK